MALIPFNIPCSLGNEPDLVRQAIANGHLSGNGPFTRQVHAIFEEEIGYHKVLMTHSCTAALEMAAMLCDLKPGDEVILPSFTHVGTANAFLRAGARLVFADSLPHHPNLDPAAVAPLIGPRTRALVLVHYAGVACDLDAFTALAQAHNLLLIEDAAHAIGARYKGILLGSFGEMAALSFHETKNLTCGQGGLLMLNGDAHIERAERIWENGTNRAAYFRGEIDHYSWVEQGACFTSSDMNAAYLSAQLLHREEILARRLHLWNRYAAQLSSLSHAQTPILSPGSAHNGHIFYLRLPDLATREALRGYLKEHGFHAVFHYIPLHSSPFFRAQHHGRNLPHCQEHSDCLLRLPLFHSLSETVLDEICATVHRFFQSHS